MTGRDGLGPEEARTALEQVEAMRRAGLRDTATVHPFLLAVSTALAFAYCAAPPLFGEHGPEVASILYIGMWYLPMLGYWRMQARPRFGRSDGALVAMIFAFAFGVMALRAAGEAAYRQGHVWAPFAAGGVAVVVFLAGYHVMGQRTREALAEQDRELVALGGLDRPNLWYVTMAFAASFVAPGAWSDEPRLSNMVWLALFLVLIGLRVGMPGWPRRPMAEEWVALALYAVVNLAVWIVARTWALSALGAWTLAALPSFAIILICYGMARRRLLAAQGEDV